MAKVKQSNERLWAILLSLYSIQVCKLDTIYEIDFHWFVYFVEFRQICSLIKRLSQILLNQWVVFHIHESLIWQQSFTELKNFLTWIGITRKLLSNVRCRNCALFIALKLLFFFGKIEIVDGMWTVRLRNYFLIFKALHHFKS